MSSNKASLPASSPYRHLVFVYGTLKRGENNYSAWLADPCHALFLGTANTRHRFPLFVNLAPDFPGCSPVLLNAPVTEAEWVAANERETGRRAEDRTWQARAQHVEGELFLVTEAMRRWLDVLEDVEDGTHVALPAEVDHVRPPPSLLRVLEKVVPSTAAAADNGAAPPSLRVVETLYEHLAAPFRPSASSALQKGGVVALLYFRAKDYPADWAASPCPSSSTRLLASFSAKTVLAEYGARFSGGIPAHHRGPGPRQALQRALDALPAPLQPPMSTRRQQQRLAQALQAQQELESSALASSSPSASTSNGSGAASEGGMPAVSSDYYAAAVDGALVQADVLAVGGAGALTDASGTSQRLFDYGTPLLPKPLALFIIDGIGDSTYTELGNRTPLEVVAGTPPRRGQPTGAATVTTTKEKDEVTAREGVLPVPLATLHLERHAPAVTAAALAGSDASTNPYMADSINTVTRAGVSGMMDPYLSGRSCGSDTAHLSFFGYDPAVYYRGRGAYETLGTAVDSSSEDDDSGSDTDGERMEGEGEKAKKKSLAPRALVDEAANAMIAKEKAGEDGTVAALPFALDDEDVCFKSNFATFADPAENSVGDEDAALERSCAALSRHQSDQEKREAGGLAFSTNASFFITHRRCDREFTEEGPVLCRYLHGLRITHDVHGVPFDYPHVVKIKYATEHRCGVALSGARTACVDAEDAASGAPAATGLGAGQVVPGEEGGVARRRKVEKVVGMLSDKITGTDCLKDGLYLRKCVPTVEQADDPAEYARAVYTCRLVEAASEKISHYLRQHGINEARRRHNRGIAEASASSGGGGKRKNVANIILFRGAAKKGWVPTFANRHGLHGVMIAPTCIIRGLGACCGLDGKHVCPVCFPSRIRRLRAALRRRIHWLCAECKAQEGEGEGEVRRLRAHLSALRLVNAPNRALAGATGDYRSDLRVKVTAALHALRLRCPWPLVHNYHRVAAIMAATSLLGTEGMNHGGSGEAGQLELQSHPHYDFLVVHVKGVDDAGHDGNHHQKLKMIGDSGEALRALFAALPDGSALCIVADHSTPLAVGDHCCEPVPVSVAVKRATGSISASENRWGLADEQVVGIPGVSLAEEVAAFRLAWEQQQQQQAGEEEERHGVDGGEGPILFCNTSFASTGELLMFLLAEKAAFTPRDGVERYSEVEAAQRDGDTSGAALGRFRGDELMGVMKRTQYYYHYM